MACVEALSLQRLGKRERKELHGVLNSYFKMTSILRCSRTVALRTHIWLGLSRNCQLRLGCSEATYARPACTADVMQVFIPPRIMHTPVQSLGPFKSIITVCQRMESSRTCVGHVSLTPYPRMFLPDYSSLHALFPTAFPSVSNPMCPKARDVCSKCLIDVGQLRTWMLVPKNCHLPVCP